MHVTSTDPEVLIIGAGLAGLYAALLLEERGASVRVLEANARVGGRVLTLATEHGPVDVGGSQLGASYTRLHALVQRFGLGTYTPISFPPRDFALSVDGQLLALATWKDSPHNRTAESERTLPPPLLASALLARHNPLDALEAWTEARHAALDIPFESYLRTLGVSDEARRLITVGNHAVALRDISALNELRKAYILRQESVQAVSFLRGGTARLPEAMRAGLTGDVLLGERITSLVQDANGVRAHTAAGVQHRARFALVTLPFSVLRGVRFEPALVSRQAEAVRTLPYSEATFAVVDVTAPFWEHDGLPAALWSDGLIGLLFPVPTESGPPGQFLAFLNGAADRQLRGVPAQDAATHLERELQRVRPSTGGNVRVSHVQSWTSEPTARGAYAFFGPGQIRGFQAAMAQSAGRIHFAGEHTAIRHSGLEGALESAERATLELMQR